MKHFLECDICDVSDAMLLFEEGQTSAPGPVVRCNRCGLVYAGSTEQEQQWLDADVWTHYIEQLKWKNLNFSNRIDGIERHRCCGKLLEVGCYVGALLDIARKRGWDVSGIEPAVGPAKYARDVYGINVYHGYLSEANYSPGSVDVVVMLEVIEHLHSPSKELEEVNRILRDDGLLVLETPNICNLSYKLLKNRWRQFMPGHCFFFSPITIRRLLEKVGFRLIEIELVPKVISLKHLGQIVGARYNRIAGKWLMSFWQKLGIENMSIRINLGDLMVVYAEKNIHKKR